MRVVCFGDSNTYGYDPRSYLGDRYPPDARWPDLLAQQTGWQVLNEGENGRTIPKTRELLPEHDLLLIMLGTNDLLLGATAKEAAEGMERFLKAQGEREDFILLIAPPPLRMGDWVREERLIEESRRYAVCLKNLAQSIGAAFADASSWQTDLAYDGVHLSEKGHRAFADAVCRLLQEKYPLD